jgi:hypothetical protein
MHRKIDLWCLVWAWFGFCIHSIERAGTGLIDTWVFLFFSFVSRTSPWYGKGEGEVLDCDEEESCWMCEMSVWKVNDGMAVDEHHG